MCMDRAVTETGKSYRAGEGTGPHSPSAVGDRLGEGVSYKGARKHANFHRYIYRYATTFRPDKFAFIGLLRETCKSREHAVAGAPITIFVQQYTLLHCTTAVIIIFVLYYYFVVDFCNRPECQLRGNSGRGRQIKTARRIGTLVDSRRRSTIRCSVCVYHIPKHR